MKNVTAVCGDTVPDYSFILILGQILIGSENEMEEIRLLRAVCSMCGVRRACGLGIYVVARNKAVGQREIATTVREKNKS